MQVRDGVWYATRFAAPQTSLLPLHAQETLVLYRPQACAASEALACLSTAIMALRIGTHGIRSCYFRTGVTDVLAVFLPYASCEIETSALRPSRRSGL
jgi:hypothetical protein